MVRPFLSANEPATPVAHEPLRLTGGAPVELPARASAWSVREGTLEAYLVWSGGRRLLAVVSEGGQVFGLSSASQAKIHLVAPDGASLVPAPAEPGSADAWVQAVSSRLGGATPRAADIQDEKHAAIEGDAIAARTRMVWLRPSRGQALDIADSGQLVLDPDVTPVFGSVWVRARSQGEIELIPSADLSAEALAEALGAFNEALVGLFEHQEEKADAAALARLGATPDGMPTERGADISSALAGIAGALGLKPETFPRLPEDASSMPIPALCRVSGLRARKVALEAGWHRRDHGPLLLRGAEDRTLHALVWDGRGYREGGGARLNAERAEDYSHTAYATSAPLPETVQGLWSLAWHVMRAGNRRDALTTAMAAAAAAGLGILTPIATAWLLSDIVPAGIAGLLFGVGIALACAAIVSTILGVARSLATTRIEGRGATVLGAALTDRLLRLPARFFKDFSAGDLNQRLQNVEQMRKLAVGIVMSAGLTAVLSVAYLGVLFMYDVRLALMGFGLVLIYIVAVVIARVLQMEAIREAATLDGEIAGLTYETLDGVGKLRASAAEERAMERWLAVYRRERAAGVRAGRVSTNFGAFADAYQTITLMTLFAGAGALAAVEAPAGIFIGFLAAFGSFQGAIVGLSEALLQVYSAQPLVERARPILTAETEIDPGRGDPGTLKGEIEGSGLAFTYAEGLPPVLNGVDFHIKPGQHMAIVGGSGSGKSTLLRLLLGFETPERGAILYDGQDLTRLDLTRVRSQIGVVLQASQLFAGSILDNIRGAGNATLEECLDAAEKAGLARDLEYFAMGLHTPITEGAGALSGGQRQRILIARALAANPNILFFDEATSALDNATQAVVAETLDALAVTRVTIAHRLSTVRHADTICVLEGGRFVEQGTFDELMALGGAFARLARRQLTGE